MGLVAFALAAGLTVVEVHNAEELLTAIGPHRTIRLAPGSYDLRAVTPRSLEFVKWEVPGIVVHDVDGLTIEGPVEGDARLTAASTVELQFDKVRDLTLRRVGIGPVLDEPIPPFRARDGFIGRLSFEHFENLVVEDVQSTRAAFDGISLREGRHAAFRRVMLGARFGIHAVECADLRIEDSWLKSENSALTVSGKTSDVVVSRTTIFSALPPDPAIELVIQSTPDATGRLVGVRFIDEITGKLRRTIADQPLPIAPGPDASGSLDVPFVIVRRGAQGPRSYDTVLPTTLRLEDGREPFKDFPGEYESALDPMSVRVGHLGSRSGPIAVTWYDTPEGNGSYTNFYYRILQGQSGGRLLMAGAFLASGHGAGSGGGKSRTFSFEGGFLTVRGVSYSMETHSPPGLPLEREDEAGTSFMTVWECAYELIYRIDGDDLVPVRYEEYSRIGPSTDVAAMLAQGAKASWPHLDGSPPKIGEWLKTILPLEQGAARYPLIDLESPDDP